MFIVADGWFESCSRAVSVVFCAVDNCSHHLPGISHWCLLKSYWHCRLDHLHFSIITTAILYLLYRTTRENNVLVPWLKTRRFCWNKVLVPHALANGNLHVRITEEMLEFSSTVFPALYLCLHLFLHYKYENVGFGYMFWWYWHWRASKNNVQYLFSKVIWWIKKGCVVGYFL